MKMPRALGLLPAAASSAARAQQLGGDASADVSFVRVFLALVICLILAALAILLVRQRLGGRGAPLLPRLTARQGRVAVVETRRLSPQAELALVEFDSTEFLLLIAPGGPLVLKERPVADRAEPED